MCRVHFRDPQRVHTLKGQDGTMRLTKSEKRALLNLLEWMTKFHNTECARLDPVPYEGWMNGGYNLKSVRDKLLAEVRLTDDERLERDKFYARLGTGQTGTLNGKAGASRPALFFFI